MVCGVWCVVYVYGGWWVVGGEKREVRSEK